MLAQYMLFWYPIMVSDILELMDDYILSLPILLC
ncbi:hypothetical protein ECH_0749 [Ehrlichia chaffeensis str. Arkansas]|uniref:Uncharacterized protein n=1 Tax=Ehrlichia chaffeensis (strain ATCC CRL-10679 / Arkansas) TaxID=205920 RepID=Q2GG86_EHRCR|nr:hypothetical protein ECH_0749 [Ehrlichia chaffeensis str. Arkansas]